MADQPTASDTTTGKQDPTKSDVPLEEIVRDGLSASIDVTAVDQLLAVEDPKFASEMSELRKQVAEDSKNVVIDALDFEEKPLTRGARLKAWLKGKKQRISQALHSFKERFADFRAHAGVRAKEFALLGVKKTKAGVQALIAKVKGFLVSFRGLPLKSKLLVLATLVLGVISLTVLKIVLKGRYLPTLETHYLRSFADVANASFEYDEEEGMEDFTDPFFHPEHVMLIDKIVVNLRRPGDGSNPMGLFEFYVEASNDEGAIEIKDREIEVRDLLSRTLERMSYEELVTISGKNKAKLVLRKAMNQFMTKGRVRRIYFRNIVLKE